MKKKPAKGDYGMVEASKKEIEYFESFEGEAVDLKQIIAQSKAKKTTCNSKEGSRKTIVTPVRHRSQPGLFYLVNTSVGK